MNSKDSARKVAIACGGTGGHLFPGLAVASELESRGASITLFVSPKEVDEQGVRAVAGRYQIKKLPLVAFSPLQAFRFAGANWKAYREVQQHFAEHPPDAVLAMGGFTSAVPILAGRRCGALTFLHESNAIPGRANRWLARVVRQAFVGFAEAADHLSSRAVVVTGTPVREEIRHADAATACRQLGLDHSRPVLLITGGSQGARGVNQLALAALPQIAQEHPELQFIHLTGKADYETVLEGYRCAGVPAVILPFSQRMDQCLGAATVVISRSGASSLAEIVARRLPSILIPYPTAADDHQRHNASALLRVNAAELLDQTTADGALLASTVGRLLREPQQRAAMATALAQLDRPTAASDIAERIWQAITARTNPGLASLPLDASRAASATSIRAA